MATPIAEQTFRQLETLGLLSRAPSVGKKLRKLLMEPNGLFRRETGRLIQVRRASSGLYAVYEDNVETLLGAGVQTGEVANARLGSSEGIVIGTRLWLVPDGLAAEAAALSFLSSLIHQANQHEQLYQGNDPALALVLTKEMAELAGLKLFIRTPLLVKFTTEEEVKERMVRVKQSVVNASLSVRKFEQLEGPPPEMYSDAVVKAKKSGRVNVRLVVNNEGRAIKVEMHGADPLLQEAIKAWAKGARFGFTDGQPFNRVTAFYKFDFKKDGTIRITKD